MQTKKLVALKAFIESYLESFCSEERELINDLSTELTSLVHSGTDVDEAIKDRTDGMIYIYWSDLHDFVSYNRWAMDEVVQQHYVELSETYSYFNHMQTAHHYYLDQMFAEDSTEIITALFLLYLYDNIDENSPEFTKDDFEAFIGYHDLGYVVGFDEFEELKDEFYEELQEESEEE